MVTTPAQPRHSTRNRAELMAQWQWALGVAITLAIGLLETLNLTVRAEYPFLDLRAREFAASRQPPSDDVAIIAIDDQALDTVGKWPWPRWRLAQVIRELDAAGAKVIALDLLLDDPEDIQIVGELKRPATLRLIDGDAELAAAIRAHGRVVLGAAFQIKVNESTGVTADSKGKSADGIQAPEKVDYRAVFTTVAENPDITLDALKHKLLSPDEAATTRGAAVDDLKTKYEWSRILMDRQYDLSIPGATSALRVPQSDDPEPPSPPLLAAAAQIASVSFGKEDLDGGVRRIPLWIRSGARLYPTLGLAAAALHLGVPIKEIRIRGTETQLPISPTQSMNLRTHRAPLDGLGEVEGLLYVTWPRGGGKDWREQFQIESAKVGASGEGLVPREIAIGRIVDPYLVQERIAQNIRDLDVQALAIARLYGFFDAGVYEQRAAELAALSPDQPRWGEVLSSQRAAWEAAAREAEGMIPAFPPEPELSPEERAQLQDLRAIARAVPEVIRRIDDGLAAIQQWRETDLPRLVRGKVCLVGWTATGALADFVRTSIDARTPGMHVHAAVLNSILTQAQLRLGTRTLETFDVIAVFAVGIIGTLIGVRFPVIVGPVALALTLGAWWLLNGAVVWDRQLNVVAAASPIAAGVLSWLAVILHRLLVEQRGRKQTEARFRSYVSPDVVDILVNNPGLSSMNPQKRELTMMFSDIAGFTTISERLETEALAVMLNTYLGAMTEILQKHRGTIDKYLGDGIMVFWGAPLADAEHARHAALAAIDMQAKLEEMNRAGAFGPAGTLGVRLGLATGEVNVGDFGNPPHKSAYTVIGDAVNLSARLESANKFFGSRILIEERVKELMGHDLRTRLLGRIVVKGKTEYQTVYELIGPAQLHGNRTQEWIDLTESAVRAYIEANFERAGLLFRRLSDEFADSALEGVYSRAIRSILSEGGVPDGFSGTIVLSEK